MQCHHNAAELLIDAMKTTNSSVALESITLQHSYHLKQKDLIKSRKEQYERVKHAMDNLRHISKDPHANIDGYENSTTQIAIYKTIDKSNTLLNTLLDKKIANQVINETDSNSKSTDFIHESVVEELQTLGQNLNSLVEQLNTQVEILKDENMTLKERVDYLEKERTKYLNLQLFDTSNQNKYPINNMKVDEQISLEPPRIYNVPVRPQQPHFDLSAFKDD